MSQLLHLTRLVTSVSYLTITHHVGSYFLCILNLLSVFCDLRHIRNTLNSTTDKTIATSLIHTKVDYWNSLFLNLPRSQLDCLHLFLNSAAHVVSRTPHFTHILSITYKTLQSLNPFYLHHLLRIQSDTCTRSSPLSKQRCATLRTDSKQVTSPPT